MGWCLEFLEFLQIPKPICGGEPGISLSPRAYMGWGSEFFQVPKPIWGESLEFFQVLEPMWDWTFSKSQGIYIGRKLYTRTRTSESRIQHIGWCLELLQVPELIWGKSLNFSESQILSGGRFLHIFHVFLHIPCIFFRCFRAYVGEELGVFPSPRSFI